ncbi:MAG: hypothetical protein ABIR59_03440 [Gemmatimonadales bacterium]
MQAAEIELPLDRVHATTMRLVDSLPGGDGDGDVSRSMMSGSAEIGVRLTLPR